MQGVFRAITLARKTAIHAPVVANRNLVLLHRRFQHSVTGSNINDPISSAESPKAEAQAENSTTTLDSKSIDTAKADPAGFFKPIEDAKQTKTKPLESETSSSKPESAVDDLSIDKFHKENDYLGKDLYNGLKMAGLENFTPVQYETLKLAATGTSIVARAKTGTGKTFAFGIPALKGAIDRNTRDKKKIGSLIIAPTRDLALQICEALVKIADQKPLQRHRLRILPFVGGQDKRRQLYQLQSRNPPNIVVATPGRLNDLLDSPGIPKLFSELQVKVLDEADRLLDANFQRELLDMEDKLLEAREKEPLLYLFSATVDNVVKSFAKQYIGDEFTYIDTVDENAPETHELIAQSIVYTPNFFSTIAAAVNIISEASQSSPNVKGIVFVPTVKSTQYVGEILRSISPGGLDVHILHGKLTQSGRERSVRNFRRAKSGLLVTTDVGARGMDFPKVTHVIQLGLPSEIADYIHRIGRTARAGLSGKAIMILSDAEVPFLRALERKNIKISETITYKTNEATETQIADTVHDRHVFDIEDVYQSQLGYYRSIVKTYRLKSRLLLEDVAESYRRFRNDPDSKLFVTKNLWAKIWGLSSREAALYFDIDKSNSRDHGSNDFGSRDYGSKDFGSRGSGSRDSGSRGSRSKDYGSKDYGSKSYGSKSYGSKSYADRSYGGSKNYGDRSYGGGSKRDKRGFSDSRDSYRSNKKGSNSGDFDGF